MKRKEFTYRGKKIEELKELDIREFSKFLTSRRKRSVLRQFDKIEKFVKIANRKIERGKAVRTHQRDIVIVPQMVGMTVYVHNGKEFAPVRIVGEMLGHYLGEFAPTRKKVEHSAPGIGATRSSAAMSVK